MAELHVTGSDATRSADAFLRAAGWEGARRVPLAGDASNRRYDRVRHERFGGAVLMDAPPEKGEDVRPFAAITGYLRSRGLSAPEIFAADGAQGFLLLEDLGDDLVARVAHAGGPGEREIYEAAVDLLVDLHAEAGPARAAGAGFELTMAPYDDSVLEREAALLTEWYLPGATGAATSPELDAEFRAQLNAACDPVAASRRVLVLRDYHAENLIWRPDRAGAQRVGLLDYQDALLGHEAYDLVSLLEDARRDVTPELSEAMLTRFAERSDARGEDLRAAFAILGAQRNLKIIGIFARLWLRDGKDKYLDHIPRVWRHLERDLAHPALTQLRDWIATHAPAPETVVLDRIRAGRAA